MAKLALAFDILASDAKASRTLDHFGDKAERTGKRVGHTFGGLGKTLVGAVAGFATINAFKGFIADAEESRRVGRLTAQVIKTTGKAAHVSAKQVGELATAISNKTGIDDEAIQSGENLLLTFTGIRNEVGKGNDIFNQATATITDMSAALGQDMKSSAIQLGKALNDPIKGVTALQRVGVSFTASQKEQIKTLVKSGDVLGAQKIILRELGKEFGGAAAAAATPMEKLKVSVGNVGESIGTLMLPAVDKIATFLNTEAVPAVNKFIDGFQHGTGAGGKFADVLGDLGDQAQAAWDHAKPIFSFIGDHPKLFAEVAKDAVILAAAMKGISTVKKLPGLGSLLGGGNVGTLGGQVATLAKPLPVFVTNPGGLPGTKGSGLGGVVGTVAKDGEAVVTGGLALRVLGKLKLVGKAFLPLAVLLANIELDPKAVAGLKNTVFPLRYKLSVNDAAKEFLAKIEDPGTDTKTRAILLRHYNAVFAGVADAAKTGNTKALEAALTATYADLHKNSGAIQREILRETAANTARTVDLISGGLFEAAAAADRAGHKIARSIGQVGGGGMAQARERADDLTDALREIPEPRLNAAKLTTPLQAGTDKAHQFIRTLGQIPKSKTLTVHAELVTTGKSVKIADLHTSGNTVYIQGRGGRLALADGGLVGMVRGPGGPRADLIDARLSNGEFVSTAKATAEHRPELEAWNAGREAPSATKSRGDYYELHFHEAGRTPRESLPRVLSNISFLLGS